MQALIVDNAVVFLEILKDLCQENKIDTTTCQTTDEAMTAIASQRFDLLCLARHFAQGDGLALTKSIRQIAEYQNIPVIMFTADETAEGHTEMLTAGVTEIFHKKELNQLTTYLRRLVLNHGPMQGRVMLVDDVISQGAVMKTMLAEHGLEVDVFLSAEEAWEAFLQNEYDLVITDVVLEGKMTGIHLISEIRRSKHEKGDIPILAVSGYDDVARRIELFNAGVNDYVTKPLIEQELMARVRNLLNGQQFLKHTLEKQSEAEAAGQAKSEFIASMGHELRNPLNTVMGFIDLLITDTNDPLSSGQMALMEHVSTATHHLQNLVKDITSINRIEAGLITYDIGSLHLSYVVKTAVQQLELKAEQSKITIDVSAVDESLYVMADIQRLHQVITNVLSNAIKYNVEGGKVQFKSRVLESGKVRLFIKDDGHGIALEDHDKLFTPFTRLGNKYETEGTGLGLTISKKLLEGMNGTIGFSSERGVGTTFWIELPRTE